jgi:hypothetical protein
MTCSVQHDFVPLHRETGWDVNIGVQTTPWDIENTPAIVAVKMVVVVISASSRLIPIR